ncbi:restriction endonuclease subunit S [Paracoccus sediminilitoris]|uniref:restriction endonuclease subunit S n=1 Tax=Paracoccus sediminilitoris TaxID=2202419 RepID=UPI000DB9A720|nr:restriction endonuclease subunit S [Paracoccus sediminilitoris]
MNVQSRVKHVALGDIAEFINGAAFKPSDWTGEGRRIIRIQNLNDPSKPFNRTTAALPAKYEVHPGTLLVSWSASLGVFEWNEPDIALLNQHIFKVVPDVQQVTQDYLRHMLENALLDMARHHRGSTMVHVNRGEFLGTTIPLPPLEEQKRIAAILDQADALRRLRRRALDRLNTLGQAIFHDMFGDDGRTPTATLAEVAYVNWGDTSVTKSQYIEEGYTTFSATGPDGYRDKFDFDGYGVVLSAIGARCGKTWLASGKWSAIKNTIVLYSESDRLMTPFLYWLTRSPDFWPKRGAAQPFITIGDARKCQIVLPKIERQQAFLKRIGKIDAQLSAAHLGEDLASSLFTSLQHRAFRGEL